MFTVYTKILFISNISVERVNWMICTLQKCQKLIQTWKHDVCDEYIFKLMMNDYNVYSKRMIMLRDPDIFGSDPDPDPAFLSAQIRIYSSLILSDLNTYFSFQTKTSYFGSVGKKIWLIWNNFIQNISCHEVFCVWSS